MLAGPALLCVTQWDPEKDLPNIFVVDLFWCNPWLEIY